MSKTEPSTPSSLSGVEAMRALAHPTRLRMVELLRQEPLSASELARRLEIRFGSARFHLQQLVRGGMAHPAGERRVRGGVELLFSSPDDVWIDSDPDDPATTAAMHRALTVELGRRLRAATADQRPGDSALDVVSLRQVRLTRRRTGPVRNASRTTRSAGSVRWIPGRGSRARVARPVPLPHALAVASDGRGPARMSAAPATEPPVPQPHVPADVDGACDLVHRRRHRDHRPRAACRIDERHRHRRRRPAARASAPPPAGPMAGVIADRTDQRRLMIACNVGNAVVFAVAALAPARTLGLIVLVATSSTPGHDLRPGGPQRHPGARRRGRPAPGERMAGDRAQHAGGDRSVAGWAVRGHARHPRRIGRRRGLVPAVGGVAPARVAAAAASLARGTTTSFLADTRAGLAYVRRHAVARAVVVTLFLGVAFAGIDNVALVFLSSEVLGAGRARVRSGRGRVRDRHARRRRSPCRGAAAVRRGCCSSAAGP